MILDTQKETPVLQLGALSVPVTDYQIKTEVPVLRDMLCDGSTEIRLLPQVPCVLTVHGTVLQSECGTYLAALQSPIQSHRAFDTEFAGIGFSGLQITDADCCCKQNSRTAVLSVTLVGGMTV